jgi:hypothetical protein
VSLAVGDKVTVAWSPEHGQWCKARVTELFVSGFRFQEEGYTFSKKWNPGTLYEPVGFDLEGIVWARGWIDDDSLEASALRVASAL